jgi:hypothetical protein
MSRKVQLTCDIDIEQSWESLHAHAIPDGIDIEAGDIIIVHDTGGTLNATHYIGQRNATLIRAGFWRRHWTRLRSIFEIAELFEVGFQPIVKEG